MKTENILQAGISSFEIIQILFSIEMPIPIPITLLPNLDKPEPKRKIGSQNWNSHKSEDKNLFNFCLSPPLADQLIIMICLWKILFLCPKSFCSLGKT